MLDDAQTAAALDERERSVTHLDVEVFGRPTSPDGRRRSPTVEEVELGLLEVGDRLAVANALRRQAQIDLDTWVAAADGRVEVKRMAHLAGVARATLYNRRAA